MNSTLLLIKANIINSWGINKVLKSKSREEKIKALLLGVVIVYAFCMAFFSIFMLNYKLGEILTKLNSLEVLISGSILSTTLFVLIMSAYKIPGYLFSFKDYDLLMALPVKPSAVLTSKITFIYLSNLLIAIIMGIPSLVAYGIMTSSGFMYYIFVLISTFFIPLIPISIGSVFAYFLGRLSVKFRSTNILMLIGSFVLFFAIMIGSSLIGQINTQQVQDSLPTISALNKVLFWTMLYIKALKGTNILHLLAFIAISLLVFSIFITVFSKSFKSVNSKMTEKFRTSRYKITTLKVSGLIKALFIREMKFYFSSYIYVVNTAFGIIMMTIFSIAVAVFGKDTVSKVLEIPMAQAFIAPMITLIFAFCISFTYTTSASISIEGKTLWIIKSLPVDTKNILWSKILLNLALTIPALIINTIIIEFSFRMDVLTILLVFLVCILYCLLSPLVGIILNLFFPKLEWNTQVAVVKQSASAFLSAMFGFLAVGIPALLFIALKPANTNFFMVILSLVLLLINLFLIKFVNTVGVKKFNQL